MIQFENAVKKFNEIILGELKEAGINCWIAGGSVRNYFMGVSTRTDYDIFFPNESEYDKAEAFFRKRDSRVKWESGNGMKVEYDGKTFDLIKKYFTGPQDTIDNFDFTVSMFAVDVEKVYHGESSFIDLAKRQLMLNKIPFPASTLSRSFRYYKKGFSMCSGEMRKLCEAIQGMPKEVEEYKDNEGNGNEPSSSDMAFFMGID